MPFATTVAHARRNPERWLSHRVLLAMVALVCVHFGVSAQKVEPSVPPFVLVRPAYGDGVYLSAHIIDLRRRSPTFRELLDAIGGLSNVRVLVAPAPTSRAAPQRLFGQTSFAVGTQETVASMEIVVSYDDPNMVAAALAHEFAHVFEAACLAEVQDVALLRHRLRAPQSEMSSHVKGGRPIETSIARELEREIVAERRGRSRAPFTRVPLLERHPVGRCAPAAQQVARVTR